MADLGIVDFADLGIVDFAGHCMMYDMVCNDVGGGVDKVVVVVVVVGAGGSLSDKPGDAEWIVD